MITSLPSSVMALHIAKSPHKRNGDPISYLWQRQSWFCLEYQKFWCDRIQDCGRVFPAEKAAILTPANTRARPVINSPDSDVGDIRTGSDPSSGHIAMGSGYPPAQTVMGKCAPCFTLNFSGARLKTPVTPLITKGNFTFKPLISQKIPCFR